MLSSMLLDILWEEYIYFTINQAMATMFAADLSTVGFKVTLVTLGSPRVGDAAFYDWIETLKISHSRIVHEKDYAPHMPPMTFGF